MQSAEETTPSQVRACPDKSQRSWNGCQCSKTWQNCKTNQIKKTECNTVQKHTCSSWRKHNRPSRQFGNNSRRSDICVWKWTIMSITWMKKTDRDSKLVSSVQEASSSNWSRSLIYAEYVAAVSPAGDKLAVCRSWPREFRFTGRPWFGKEKYVMYEYIYMCIYMCVYDIIYVRCSPSSLPLQHETVTTHIISSEIFVVFLNTSWRSLLMWPFIRLEPQQNCNNVWRYCLQLHGSVCGGPLFICKLQSVETVEMCWIGNLQCFALSSPHGTMVLQGVTHSGHSAWIQGSLDPQFRCEVWWI